MATEAALSRWRVRERSVPGAAPDWMAAEDRQLLRMLKVGFVFFLVCGALRRLAFWRRGDAASRQSLVREARDAADTYIPQCFALW